VLRRVAPDVIPFAGVFAGVGRWVRGFWKQHKVFFVFLFWLTVSCPVSCLRFPPFFSFLCLWTGWMLIPLFL
jgi:hypothetical protein